MRGITQNDSNNLSALKMGTIHPINSLFIYYKSVANFIEQILVVLDQIS